CHIQLKKKQRRTIQRIRPMHNVATYISY
ncbi:TerC family protein, partial [Vibrio parahaemolyticus]|nr:TerC family protein [Vibrio parahaemolyticus]EGR1670276.1 TerC family protein [Vibrio parahaemolyticus]EGU9377071.1 TerC family protein [Vibrio parahaemolyticus]